MNPLLFFYALILSILPVSELRGGIPLAIGSGANPLLAFFFATMANILIIPIVFFFFDYLHEYFMKIPLYYRIFNKYISRLQDKVHSNERKVGYWLLFSFVAIPFPGTGAYTGCIIAWFFKMPRKNSMKVIALGVFTAGILVTLASLGIFSLF